MSAISGFINTIRNAVYGEQVRGAIISALEQCYSDVNAPSLQTAAFTAALNAAYAGGILDIQTVTQISAMTNQNIIYRYNGTEAGKQKGLYYYSALSSSWVLIGSEIHAVSLIAQMTDTNAIYKYTGTQSGMVQNSLYCYNGTAWVPIGSGVLTASTAAGMTNTGAIYKYTGTQTGMIQNALYYHNGTDWIPVSKDTNIFVAARNNHLIINTENIPATSMTINPLSIAVSVGSSAQLSIVFSPVYASVNADGAIWATSDASVATIDSNGVVTGVSSGSATISATINGQTLTSTVTVEGEGGLVLSYSWDASSGTIPQGATYTGTPSFSNGKLTATNLNIDLDFYGTGILEIVGDFSDAPNNSSDPQLILCHAIKSGAKILGAYGSSGVIATNATGSVVASTISKSGLRTYTIDNTSGEYIVKVNNTTIGTGSGVSNNEYIYYTGIYTLKATINLKSIKLYTATGG